MAEKIRQTSFASGELAPSLYGRSDFQKWASGCKLAENFFVSPHGSLVNRPGTKFLAELPVNYEARLVPFIFSDTDTVLVVVGSFRILFYVYDQTTGTIERKGPQLSSPYDNGEDLSLLRTSQVGDVMTMVHPDVAPQELRRLTSDNEEWEIEPVDFSVEDFPSFHQLPVLATSNRDPDRLTDADASHPALEWDWQITKIMRRADGTTYETEPRNVLGVRQYNFEKWVEGNEYGTAQAEGSIDWVYLEDRPLYIYLALNNLASYEKPPLGGSDNWNEYDVMPAGSPGWSSPAQPDSIVLAPDRPVIVDWRNWIYYAHIDVPSSQDPIIATRVYRGRAGSFGYVGQTTDEYFIDEGQTPDFSRQPPSGDNPFEVINGDGIVIRTENPRTVCMYEGRRLFGGTDYRPAFVWGSAVADYNNFDVPLIALDGDSYSFEIATSQFESIRAMVPWQQLVLLTDTAEWLVGGSGQQAITPNSIAARLRSSFGSGRLEPLRVNDLLFFIQRKGTVPRMMEINPNGNVAAADISILSKHLFTGHTIIDWAFAEDPWALVWAVRDDGVLLSCAVNRDEQMLAWTQHELPGVLEVLSIVSIPEGLEDAVYLLTRRSVFGNPYIERMSSRVITDTSDAMFLDGAVTWDGRNTTDVRMNAEEYVFDDVAIGLHEPLTVRISDDLVPAPATMNGRRFRLYGSGEFDDQPLDVFVDAHGFTSGGWHLYTGLSYGYLSAETITAEAAKDASVQAINQARWAEIIDTVDGLSHLEGQEVYALIDGNIEGPFTVEGGSVTLPYHGALIHVGLAYESVFKSLQMAQANGRQKVVKAVTVEGYGRGGYAGTNPDKLTELPGRSVSDKWDAVPEVSFEHRVLVRDSHDTHGEVMFKQSDPLPVELLGITRDVEVGGE